VRLCYRANGFFQVPLAAAAAAAVAAGPPTRSASTLSWRSSVGTHFVLRSWRQLGFDVSFVLPGRERTALVIVSIVAMVSVLANAISFCCYCCSCKLRRRGCCWTLCTRFGLWCRGFRRRLRRRRGSVQTVDTEMQAVGQGTVQKQEPRLGEPLAVGQDTVQQQQPQQQSQMQRDLELLQQQQQQQWQRQEDLRTQMQEQQQQQRELEREREVRELRRLNKFQRDQLEMQRLTVKTLMDVKGLKPESTTEMSGDNPFL
jgi:hypothetical protein